MNDRVDPPRLRRERKTVRAMVAMYCAHHHGRDGLCDECVELADYAERRLDRCPYGGGKPACTKCPIHCYRPEARERMREVMRFAGPRMLWRHPYLAIRHLLDDRKPVPPLPKSRPTAVRGASEVSDADQVREAKEPTASRGDQRR
ncbi:MAG: nitrous oxide-stimulated promoter family protein [Holophagae bacterium]